MSRVIVNAAITGLVVGKSDNSALPVTNDEIVECVTRLQDEGVSIVHLHARGNGGECGMSLEPQVYQDLVGRVRESCPDMIVCLSLSGRHVSDIDCRCIPLMAKPDMASLSLGSLNFPKGASVNDPDTIVALAERIYATGAVPELEVFEPGFVNYAHYLIRKGVLKAPYYFNIILGSLGTSPLDLTGLGLMVKSLPSKAVWAVGGIGRYQLDANVMSLSAGGHVRVGLEDALYYDRKRTVLADNISLVKRVARIAREMGREPASPAEARLMMGLSSKR